MDKDKYIIPKELHDRKKNICEEKKPRYSLPFKIYIIKELLKQTMERQNIYLRNPDSYDSGYWNWEQSERCALLTVLDILDDDISCIAKETINDAHKSMDEDNL